MKFVTPAWIFSCLGLAALILVSLYIPGYVLYQQDKNTMNTVTLISRSGPAYHSTTYPGYEMDVHSRLSSFAGGLAEGNSYIAVSTDYTNAASLDDLISTLQDSVRSFYEIYGLECPDISSLYEQIVTSKFYVIYEEGKETGAAFTCWLLQFQKKQVYDITLLLDSKDSTIYYAELNSYKNQEELYDKNISSAGDSSANFIHYAEILYQFLYYNYSPDQVIGVDRMLEQSIIGTDINTSLFIIYGENHLTCKLSLSASDWQDSRHLVFGIHELSSLLFRE